MNLTVASILVFLGAVATFIAGFAGILYRSPTNLNDELVIYCVASILTLTPFAILGLFLTSKKYSKGFIVLGATLMGTVGVYLHLSEMMSSEASWGFSIILVPAIQFCCLLVLWALLALSSD